MKKSDIHPNSPLALAFKQANEQRKKSSAEHPVGCVICFDYMSYAASNFSPSQDFKISAEHAAMAAMHSQTGKVSVNSAVVVGYDSHDQFRECVNNISSFAGEEAHVYFFNEDQELLNQFVINDQMHLV